MFMADSVRMSEIISAAVNSKVSHSAFRLYTVLVTAADRRIPTGSFAPVDYEALTKVLPGVKGKPMVLSTVRANLRELRQAGLIEMALSAKPNDYILVRLIQPDYVGVDKVRSAVLYEDDSR